MSHLTNTERVSSGVIDKFVLLLDFYPAFKRMELPIEMNVLEDKVVRPFRDKIGNAIPNLITYDIEYIRNITSKRVDERYFRITMDDGTYFSDYDYNFNITRSAFRLDGVRSGPYFRVPRGEDRMLISQGNRLLDEYLINGSGKPIALCDDGVGTGRSLENIINVLNELKINATKIFVLLNPNGVDSVGKNDVETLIPIEDDFAWLSERDLFWGLPRSGVTCSIEGKKLGVPYTIDHQMILDRIADFGGNMEMFRKICLEFSIKFLETIEEFIGKELTFQQVNRLREFGALMNLEGVRVVDYIKSIESPNFHFIPE